MSIAILTDFINFDESYSLCRIVADQCKILTRLGYTPRLIVREGFKDFDKYQAEIVPLYHPPIVNQLTQLLKGIDLAFTHDLIFQSGMVELCEIARETANNLPDLKWLHWVHSNGHRNHQVYPNAKIVSFHPEEIRRKEAFGYSSVVIPNPVDIMADYDPLAIDVINHNKLWLQDIIALYPCRLDRGKQPHIVGEIFQRLYEKGYRVKVIVADFHSTGGDKVVYRDEMKKRFGDLMFFTSDLSPYQIPHKAVMNLFEYCDVLVLPSQSETDSLILHEAMWQRCGLILNFDLPRFREYDDLAIFGKFSSNIDTLTGERGETTTNYGNRDGYMRHIAAQIANQMKQNPILKAHVKIRQERSLEALQNRYWEVISGI